MSASELVAAFDLDRVTHAAAGFDRAKLDWLNGEWIRRLVTRGPDHSGRTHGAGAVRPTGSTPRCSRAAVVIAQERAVTLAQLVEQMDFLFVDRRQSS